MPAVFATRSNMWSGPHCTFRYAQARRRWYQVALRLCSPFQGAKSFSFTQHWSYIENPKNHRRRTSKKVSGEFRKVVSWKNHEDKKSGSGSQSKPSVEINKANSSTYFVLIATTPSCCFWVMNLLDVEASVQLYRCEPSWEEEESFASWGFRSTEESFAGWGFRSTVPVKIKRVNYFTYLCIDSDDFILLLLSNEIIGRWGVRSSVPLRTLMGRGRVLRILFLFTPKISFSCLLWIKSLFWILSFRAVCINDDCIPYSHLGPLTGQMRSARNRWWESPRYKPW